MFAVELWLYEDVVFKLSELSVMKLFPGPLIHIEVESERCLPLGVLGTEKATSVT